MIFIKHESDPVFSAQTVQWLLSHSKLKPEALIVTYKALDDLTSPGFLIQLLVLACLTLP